MNTPKRRSYHSPLRETQTRETRERILAAVAAWLQRETTGEFTLDAIAVEAGVERRTLFRHFDSKDALLAAFWEWVNARVAPRPLPESLEDLIAAPREAFARFDEQAGVMRASLHSPAGRAMRMATVPRRRAAFANALREVTRTLPPAEARHLTAVAHLLYSAAAWETMRDYAGVTGAQAGDAASWALERLVDAARARPKGTRSSRSSRSNP